MACLPNPDASSVLFVQSTHDDNGFALCNLNKKSTAQCSLQHEFGPEDSPIVFWTTGDDIHMTGNWIWDEDELSDDDSCEHDSIQDDQEEEDEVVEAPPVKEEKPEKKASTGKRTRDTVSTESETSISSKKQKQPKEKVQRPPTERIIPSEELVVISKPPSDTSASSRGVWKIKPLNNEGTLIPSPKQKSQSGVLVSDYVVGNGAEPKLGSTVCITYEGLFPDGKRFDANLKRSKPLKFRKGSGQVIHITSLPSDSGR
jgi:FKBP-type peptidyl-prolyl cis-trans isomerase